MLKKEGFQDVCKLRGGVQHYGNSLGARHWDGRLFVFDRRDSIAVGKYDEASVVGRCHVCGKPCEDVWNCHNYELLHLGLKDEMGKLGLPKPGDARIKVVRLFLGVINMETHTSGYE